MEKNLILAVVLSIVVLIVFQFMFSSPISVQDKNTEVVEKAEKRTEASKRPAAPIDSVQKDEGLRKEQISDDIKELEKSFILENGHLILKFSNVGGEIKEIYLKDYKTSDNTPWPLLKISAFDIGVGKMLFNDSETVKNNIWQTQANKRDITFSLFLNDKITIKKKFEIVSPYEVELSVYIKNKGRDAKELKYSIFGTSNIYRPSRLDRRYSSILISHGKGEADDISLSDVKKGITEEPGTFQWMAEKSSYFSMIFLPQNKMMASLFYGGDDDFVATGAKMIPSIINGNSTEIHTYRLFFGPNDSEILEQFNKGCGQIVSFGIFTPISKFLLAILKFIYSIVNNYGVAIILLTLIVNLCLSPLTLKSIKSMKKMQTLQPHVNKLKDEHKDDPQRMNKELMALYKEKGGNPLGGCFPMLLQFPIFISLYLALTKSIELKGANFLWISDLAAPDALFTLPTSLPFIGNNINILPICMLIAMFIQQRISQSNTSMQAGMQKQFAVIMPIVFGFIFYHFPSGLVLYWLTNTIVMSLVNWKMLKTST